MEALIFPPKPVPQFSKWHHHPSNDSNQKAEKLCLSFLCSIHEQEILVPSLMYIWSLTTPNLFCCPLDGHNSTLWFLACIPLSHSPKLSSFSTQGLYKCCSHSINAFIPTLIYLLIFISQLKCHNFKEPTLITHKTGLLLWHPLFFFFYRSYYFLHFFFMSHSPSLPNV